MLSLGDNQPEGKVYLSHVGGVFPACVEESPTHQV